jgi:MFS family permease
MSFREVLSIPGIKSVFFTLFMASFGFGVILPLLPFYALAHGAKPIELGMLTATFAFMSFMFGPIMGKIADKIGRKKVLLVGTGGFVLSYLIFSIADTMPLLFFARAVEGIAAACIFPACVSLISDYTNESQRGRAMGLVGMSFSLGFIVGPAFGGLASGISVQAAFLLAAAFAAANFASVFLQIREPKEKEESRDIAQKEVGLLSHLSSPLLFLFLSTFVITFMIGGLDATLAIYTGEKLGFHSTEIGMVFTYIGILIMIMQFVSGGLVNTHGEIKLISAGFVLSGFGFFFLVFAHDWLTLMVALAVFVCGNALVFPSVNSLITKKVTGKRGAVLGLVNSFQSLGQVAGPLLGGFLYGIDHDWPFAGMAIVIWAYCIVFWMVARKKLQQVHSVPGAQA